MRGWSAEDIVEYLATLKDDIEFLVVGHTDRERFHSYYDNYSRMSMLMSVVSVLAHLLQ